MVTVTVCVGSSCHLKGARHVIVRFNELLKESGLENEVTLKGSFCMERCGEGVNWQIDDEPFTSPSQDDAVETFRQRVLKPLRARRAGEAGGSAAP
ncbi:MAG TPA: (2Fe-2S) ferredoxin domain-containing protein [Phycisphaerae bacterium]|nr:(2Fe-2S) ferredoxin domain-containing protein [Phycisphaerae bacterium]